MKISRNWLADFVDLNSISDSELAHSLTMKTAEIEEVHSAKANLKGLVVGQVMEKRSHSNADRLSCCVVSTGNKTYQVVCGAPNVAEGQKIVFAPVGTTLSGNFKLEKRKIRGELSEGMICAEDEIGLGTDHSEIIVLDGDNQIGTPIEEVFNDLDTVYEIDNKSLTNRPDLWGIYGFAREIAVIYQKPLRPHTSYDFKKSITPSQNDNKYLHVEIKEDAAALCKRYIGIVVDNITIEPSPQWLQKRILAVGGRPINNIVDLTNFVMYETGQPFHAFDYNLLQGKEILIRRAKDQEKYISLDDKEIILDTENLIIADQKDPIALAGVMGGKNSEINPESNRFVLEVANFDATSIRKTRAKIGLRTESSERFEKSLDPYGMDSAVNRFLELLKQIMPGVNILEYHDVGNYQKEPITVETSTTEINNKLGTNLKEDEICQILQSLQFDIQKKNGQLSLVVPTFRATKDVQIPADIVEEIGRVYGYDNIQAGAPLQNSTPPPVNTFFRLKRNIKNLLSLELGYTEVENYSFTSQQIIEKAGYSIDNYIELENATSQDFPYLIQDLVPSLLENAKNNLRYYEDFTIYEIGNVFINKETENTMCSGVRIIDPSSPNALNELRIDIESLLNRLNIAGINCEQLTTDLPPYAHPHRTISYSSQNKNLITLGEIHPQVLKVFGLPKGTTFFSFELSDLLQAPPKNKIYKKISKYPSVLFDIAILADQKTPAKKIQQIIKKASPNIIRSVDLFDEYIGDTIPTGKKSLAFKVIFQSMTETLDTQTIRSAQDKIINDLAKQGYDLRPG